MFCRKHANAHTRLTLCFANLENNERKTIWEAEETSKDPPPSTCFRCPCWGKPLPTTSPDETARCECNLQDKKKAEQRRPTHDDQKYCSRPTDLNTCKRTEKGPYFPLGARSTLPKIRETLRPKTDETVYYAHMYTSEKKIPANLYTPNGESISTYHKKYV